MESAKALNLDLLESQIRSLYESNKLLIQKIESLKTNEIKTLKSYNVIQFKSIDKAKLREPLSIHSEDIVDEESMAEYIENWFVPDSMEKPEEVDPDKFLYPENRDLMSMKCENYEDLIRINQQINIAMKYLSLLRESASYIFGMKFKKNYEIIRNLLTILLKDLEKKESNEINNKSIETQVKIEEINKLFLQLFAFDNVLNSEHINMKLDSKILNKITLSMLYSMFSAKRKKFKLIYDSSKNVQADVFNQLIRHKGPALIIIKNNLNFVFGAYVFDKMNATSWIVGSKETFLFTFGNENLVQPIKLLHNGGNGLYTCGSGLHLGSDLVVFCTHTSNPQVYNTIAPGYNNVEVNNMLLAGASSWTTALVEVFEEII